MRQDYPGAAVCPAQPAEKTTWFDLENPADVAKLDQPMIALESLRGIVILDEIQRRPDLFPVLRVLVDRSESARFLILGSASPDLLRQSSETLAGRITFVELGGFTIDILPTGQMRRLWIRGGFPPAYLCAVESTLLSVASGFHYDLFGERRSQPRHSDSRTPAAAVLDDALALPRPSVQLQ